MSTSLRIGPGIECCSTGTRLSWLGDGVPLTTVFVDRDDSGWVEALSTPFLPEAVGMGGAAGSLSEARLAQHWRHCRLRLEEASGRMAGRAVIVVPTRCTATQRAGLRRVALAAGFPDAEMINQAVAAVLAHTADRRQASSLLVVVLDRSAFELAVVRVARGDHRVLGHDSSTALSMGSLERLIARRLLVAAGWKGDAGVLTGAVVQGVLAESSRVLSVLMAADRTEARVVPLEVGRDEAIAPVERSDLAADLEAGLADLAARAQALLQGCGLDPTDIDVLLLAGEGAALWALTPALAGVTPRAAVVGSPELTVIGGALLARQLATKPLPEVVVRMEATAEQALDPARERLARGDLSGARRYLEEVMAAAATMLGSVAAPASVVVTAAPAPAVVPAPAGERPVRGYMARGERLFAAGNAKAAVEEGHAAWQADPTDGEAFLWMIDIHCRAAERAGVGFEEARRWLECALGHDPPNQRVRALLAECFFREAKVKHLAGSHTEALGLIERSLTFVPDHPGAVELRREVRRR